MALLRIVAVVFCVCLSLTAAAQRAPNIVLILMDDLGWADLGCYGSSFYKTPNLDKLAKDGMRFTDAYAACPVCSPTRASLMTGKYPARLNLTDWLPGRPDRPEQMLARPNIRQQLPLEETTLAEALGKAGYATAHVGKWHLGGEGFGPAAQGFQHQIAGDHTGTPLSYFAPFQRAGRFMPGLEKAEAGEYLTDRLTVESCKFIEANKAKPFFLYLAHYAVHTPLTAKAEYINRYPNATAPGSQSNRVYAAMVQSMDESVGRIVQCLQQQGLTENTLMLFTSDNGGLCTVEGPQTPATFNGPLREGKGWLYDGGIRVPLLARWPGVIKPGSVCAEPVSSVDLFPTVLAAAGAAVPAGVDGVNVLPLLKGQVQPRGPIYWHYPHYSNQGGKPGGAVRDGDWKLIEWYESGRSELFNVRADRGEGQNQAPKETVIANRLRGLLDAWRRETGAQMPLANPQYRPNPPRADGTIFIHSRTAQVHGRQLRYEPLPHKDTLGYWVDQEDWASFEFTTDKPGVYEVEVLQGCGKGQGGSVAAFAVGDQRLEMTVEDTGHFQNFVPRVIGRVTLKDAGRHTLTVRPVKKAKAAVMDLRSLTLRPVR
ncbi:MAG: N-acetylgalactosamine 6-sulfate sulfatase (GALNS) [Pedosphaera sp.]|nr:N-acetylgalactosamine 6-sulfate sulfatase (GALNS) [Pedosphaera sp.]